MTVLDIGAGRTPSIPASQRPERVRYLGLDIDAAELDAAEPGSYDRALIAPAEEFLAELEGQVDLVLSFFALEHVRSTHDVFRNVHRYLRPGGSLIAQLAGRNSPFALLNRALPGRVARDVLARTQGRACESIFQARYDRCSYTALTELLEPLWGRYEVRPLFTGAGYVLFSRALTAAYVAYEEWTYRGKRFDLAPYYLVAATKS
jgi:SAM-dependent methyltransferase